MIKQKIYLKILYLVRLNSEEITKKIKEEDQLLKIKEEEIELQKKKDKNAKLRARARKYLYC